MKVQRKGIFNRILFLTKLIFIYSSAGGFKIGSLSKLSQTKANNGETLLEYIVTRLGHDIPDVLSLKNDFPSLEVAKLVSISTLNGDISKIENSYKSMCRFIEELAVIKNNNTDSNNCFVLQYDKLKEYQSSTEKIINDMKREFGSALESHSNLCMYLGEDKSTDPETIYGVILSFASSVSKCASKLKPPQAQIEYL
jgi:hypothetical protein